MTSKYVLCFKGKTPDGKEEIYPIYESSLRDIDMYTSYKICFSYNDLYRFLPDEVKNFIKENLCDGTNIEDNFFIRKKCKDIRRGRTDLSILYNKDADIVYAKDVDIYSALYEMKLDKDSYYKNDIETKIKRDFFKEVCRILFEKESELSYEIDNNNEKLLTGYSRLESISILPSNFKIIASHVYKNYELKRKFLILLKEYKKNLDDLQNIKTRLVNKLTVENRMKNRKFSIYSVNENMENLLQDEKNYFYKKYPKKRLEDGSKSERICSIGANEDDFIDNYNCDGCVTYLDSEPDDFLGPIKANDPRYRNIN